jgi:O-antigen/teichoic acid export membrane protein
VLAALGANVFGRVLNIAIQVLSTAIFLRTWGVNLYGQWLIVTAIPVYLTSADLGFSAAAANEMTIQAGRGNLGAAEAVFRSCLGLVLLASGLVIAGAFLLLEVWPIPFDLPGAQIAAGDMRTILLLLIFSVALSLPGELFAGAYRVGGRLALSVMTTNAFIALEFALSMFALIVFRTPLAVAVAIVSARILRSVGTAILLRFVLRWPASFLPDFSLAAMRRLFAPALGFASFPISRALGNQGLILVVGQALGPAAVVVFSSGRTACRFVSTLSELFVNSVFSEISTAYGQGRTDMLRRLQRVTSQSALWLGLAAGAAIIAAKDPIAAVWLKGRVHFTYAVLVPLVIAEIAASVYRINLVILTAANRHVGTAVVYLVQSILVVVTAWILTPILGVPGACLALATGESAMLLRTFVSASQMVEANPALLIGDMFRLPVEPIRIGFGLAKHLAGRIRLT